MIINLVKAHLKDTFSYRKFFLFYLIILLFLLVRLYMFTNYLEIMDQPANLFDWILYSIGGPIGDTRLLQGFFFLILLFILITFCRSIYEKNSFIYSILLSKANSRFNWMVSIFISQFINTIISILITVKITLLFGFVFFETEETSFYIRESLSLSTANIVSILFSIICGVWIINCLLSMQNLFPEYDLSNQAMSAVIITVLLILHVYFPNLDNFNLVAYTSLSSLLSYHNHLGVTVIFRLIVSLLINSSLFLLSLKLTK